MMNYTIDSFIDFCEKEDIMVSIPFIEHVRTQISGLKHEQRDGYNWFEFVRRAIFNRKFSFDNILKKCGVPVNYLYAEKSNINQSVWGNTLEFLDEKVSGLYLKGSVGCGKTYLSVALLKYSLLNMPQMVWNSANNRIELTKLNLYTRFVAMNDLLSEIKSTYQESDKSETDIIQKYTQGEGNEFLIIDDIGIEKPTEWAIQTIYTIIDSRSKNTKRTILSSNLTIGEIGSRLGERISSRITGMCKTIDVGGEDRRKKMNGSKVISKQAAKELNEIWHSMIIYFKLGGKKPEKQKKDWMDAMSHYDIEDVSRGVEIYQANNGAFPSVDQCIAIVDSVGFNRKFLHKEEGKEEKEKNLNLKINKENVKIIQNMKDFVNRKITKREYLENAFLLGAMNYSEVERERTIARDHGKTGYGLDNYCRSSGDIVGV